MGQLLFKKCFFDAIRAETKRTTIRRWTDPRLKPGQRTFTPGVGWLTIESVDEIELSRLTVPDAHAAGFASLAEMKRVLHKLYPSARSNRDGRRWFKVTFALESPDSRPTPSRGAQAQRRARPPRPRAKPSSADRDGQRRALADALRDSSQVAARLFMTSPDPD